MSADSVVRKVRVLSSILNQQFYVAVRYFSVSGTYLKNNVHFYYFFLFIVVIYSHTYQRNILCDLH